jgi:hypothetical protein
MVMTVSGGAFAKGVFVSGGRETAVRGILVTSQLFATIANRSA